MADTKIVVNCETGEVQEIELTAEEIAQRAADAQAYAAQKVADEAEAARLAEVKASRNAKLMALGLTAEELSL